MATIKIDGKDYPIDKDGRVTVNGKRLLVITNMGDWKADWRRIRARNKLKGKS